MQSRSTQGTDATAEFRPGLPDAALPLTVDAQALSLSVAVPETHDTTWLMVSVAACDGQRAMLSEGASKQKGYDRLRIAMNSECLSGLNDSVAEVAHPFKGDAGMAVEARNGPVSTLFILADQSRHASDADCCRQQGDKGWGAMPTNASGFNSRAESYKKMSEVLSERVTAIGKRVAGLEQAAAASVGEADCVMRFDCGAPSPRPGWLGLSSRSEYSSERGWGWESGQSSMRATEGANAQETVLGSALASDQPAVLRVDRLVPGASYHVTAVVGTFAAESARPAHPVSVTELASLDEHGAVAAEAYGVIPDAGQGLDHHVAMPCKADSKGQLRLRLGAAGGSIGPLFGGATDLWRLSALLLQNTSQRPTPRALARLDQAQDWAADAIRERWSVAGPFPDPNCTAMTSANPASAGN
eukprot:COSAG04_NODE_1757_length_5668_cov_4.390734_1_plen_414_part_10